MASFFSAKKISMDSRILLLGDKQGSKTIFVSNDTEGMLLIGFFIGNILLWVRPMGDVYSLYIFIASRSRIRGPGIGMSLSDKNSYFFAGSARPSPAPRVLWPRSMVVLIGFLWMAESNELNIWGILIKSDACRSSTRKELTKK